MKKKSSDKPIMQCCTCRHFQNVKHEDLKKLCINLGSISTSPACHLYCTDVHQVADYDAAFKPLARLLQHIPTDKLSVMYDIIAHEKRNRARGFTFHEKVAVQILGTKSNPYLSNYAKARIYKVTSDLVYLVSETGILITCTFDSVIKWTEFREIRKSLIAKKRLTDPANSLTTPVKVQHGVVRELEDVYFDDYSRSKKVKSVKKLKLSTLNIKIENGEIPFFAEEDSAPKTKKSKGNVSVLEISRGFDRKITKPKSKSKKSKGVSK